jgi:RNA-splicing ligase RtcB
MARIILRYFGVSIESCEVIESVHNYIDQNDQIVRKGAISAYEGQKVVIPMNMAFGTVIGVGKGSSVHNWSAPHGAGRVMGRNVAKRTLKMDDFKVAMKDVFSTTVSEATLDEAPMAYKDPEKILSVLGETVQVESILKPIYNFKDATKEKT